MKDGTPRFGGPGLCATCKRATRIEGERTTDRILYCHVAEREINFRVTECNSHQDVTVQNLYEMKQIAWLVDRDNRGVVGFVKPSDLRRRPEHKHLKDELDHVEGDFLNRQNPY